MEQKENQLDFSFLKLVSKQEEEIPLSGFQLNSEKAEINKLTVDTGQYLFLWNKTTMLSGFELDILGDKVKADKLPDIFFGHNRFYIIFPVKNNLILEICPIQMINFSNYELIKENFIDLNTENKEEHINSIYYCPEEVKSQFWEKWKNIKVPEQTEVKTLKANSDWNYCSPYMGIISSLNEHSFFEENKNGLYKFISNYKNDKKNKIKREITDESIPVERLGQNNPVIEYWEIPLFDDELNDNGLSMSNFRVRVMKDCWFGLLRSYLRVDNVLVRIIDTRMYHELGTNKILRDFQVKENTYEELKSKGFNTGSQWSLSHSQSDLVYQSLDLKLQIKDRLIFE